MYFNTLTITLTLVMLSGSSLGALRELVAVAGIIFLRYWYSLGAVLQRREVFDIVILHSHS